MTAFKRAAVAASLLVFSLPALAQDHKGGDVTLSHPWVRIMPAAAENGAGYVTITNKGDTDNRLTGASSPFAEIVEIHEMSMDNGIMRMRPLENGLDIPAGESVALAPGGVHIMFKRVTTPFAADTKVPVTLTFMHGGPVEIMFPAKKRGDSMDSDHSHNMDEDHDMTGQKEEGHSQ